MAHRAAFTREGEVLCPLAPPPPVFISFDPRVAVASILFRISGLLSPQSQGEGVFRWPVSVLAEERRADSEMVGN